MNCLRLTRLEMLTGLPVGGIISLAISAPSAAADRDTTKLARFRDPQITTPDLKPEVGFGSLKGQFILESAIPELQPAAILTDRGGGDIKLCGATHIPNEMALRTKEL